VKETLDVRVRIACALATCLLASLAHAESESPAEGVHLGVASCASAPCHGAAAPEGKHVLQNEYVTWMKRDVHARSYQTLRSERSQKIARNLALGANAWEAPLCLDCHADHVPEALRGKSFTLEDGVGCEACHGGSGGGSGSEGWLRSHAHEATTHAQNVERGLVPLDRPEVRAERCLDCHLGNQKQLVNHRIMGAGHPRMSFELDTFTQVEPAHFRVEEDYAARGKVAAPHAKIWAIGQAVQARRSLRLLADPAVARHGIWPEYVFFDCYACHHPMSDLRWQPRPGTGLEGSPGVARLDDANLLMLRRALDVVAPDAAARLGSATIALHAALSRGEGSPARAIDQASSVVTAALPLIDGWQPTAAQVRGLASGLAQAAAGGFYRDYSGSEQAVMAIQALAASLHAQGDLGDGALTRINALIEKLLADTHDPERFDPRRVPPELQQLQAELR
jgi:hypothetical protein